MNNIAFGQYVEKDSLIHRLDPRNKFISLVILMVVVFLIPSPLKFSNPYLSFIGLGIIAFIALIIILLTKIPLLKYLKSLKQIFILLIFAFVVQVLTTKGEAIADLSINFSPINIGIIVLVLVLFIVFRKYLKLKGIIFLVLLAGSFYLLYLELPVTFYKTTLTIYKEGLFNAIFYSARIFIVIILSTTFTLTTKPTDIAGSLDWLLHPLTWLKINVSIFTMMISLALRFIPTLFNETTIILKSQESRGASFKEGNLKQQVFQIISLLIPMFVISYKRAEDLAFAMEARAYIPGDKRTSYKVLKFGLRDLFSFLFILLLLAGVIVGRIILL